MGTDYRVSIKKYSYQFNSIQRIVYLLVLNVHIAFFHTPVDVNFQTNNIVDNDCRPEGQNQCYSHFGGTLPTPPLQQVSLAISHLLPEMTMNFKVIERMTQKVNNMCSHFWAERKLVPV